MNGSSGLLRQWRWWLLAAIVVVGVSALVASQNDQVGSGGAVGATPSSVVSAATDVTATSTTAITVPEATVPEATAPDASVITTSPAATSTPVTTATAATTTEVANGVAVGEVAAGEPAMMVDELLVAEEAPRRGYDRALFPHWLDLDGNGCTTRQDLLRASVIGFPQVDLFDSCVIVEGDWFSVYDGVTHEGQPGDVDVDHVVALAEAWDSGAWAWDEATRRRFANDPDNLLVVTASSNRSKSDHDLATWRPAQRDAWCLTATITVQVKRRYGLSVDIAEVRALRELLSTCDQAGSLVPPSTVSAPVTVPATASTPASTRVPAPSAVSAPCIDLNTASEGELQAIVHIGPQRASEIIRLRPFGSVADLDRVTGIGAARLADIVDQGLVCP